jgi:DNA adenine methylase
VRYPGGKAKLINEIGGFITAYYRLTGPRPYCEPFFGGGSVGLHLMSCLTLPGAQLNDLDPGIAAIWQTIAGSPAELCDAISRFEPTADAFYDLRTRILTGTITESVQLALAKLAIHQMSFSGLGTMAGGPMGGRAQGSDDAVGSRWNAESLCGEVRRAHRLMAASGAVVTNLDFEEVLTASREAFLYLDPPYYVKGSELYQHAFTEADHLRLADGLRRSTNPWILSYDDTPEVRELYAFAQVLEMTDLRYTINTSRTKGELLILSPNVPNLFDRVAAKRKYACAGRDIFEE